MTIVERIEHKHRQLVRLEQMRLKIKHDLEAIQRKLLAKIRKENQQ